MIKEGDRKRSREVRLRFRRGPADDRESGRSRGGLPLLVDPSQAVPKPLQVDPDSRAAGGGQLQPPAASDGGDQRPGFTFPELRDVEPVRIGASRKQEIELRLGDTGPQRRAGSGCGDLRYREQNVGRSVLGARLRDPDEAALALGCEAESRATRLQVTGGPGVRAPELRKSLSFGSGG